MMTEKLAFDSGKHFSIRIPTCIEFGWNISKQIGELMPSTGHKCLIVTQERLLDLPAIMDIIQFIHKAGYEVQLYTDIEQEVSASSVDRASKAINKQSIDIIVAIGGGSAIDFAKAISVIISQHGPIWDYVGYTGKQARTIEKSLTPLVAIPTTAGTGSEVTPYAVIVNKELGCKATIVSPKLTPTVAIIDPSLTLSLPPEVTAYTGADALAQCIESYLNLPNRTHFSAIISREGIRSAASSLTTAVNDPNDHSARSLMAWASLMGGLSISMAGTGIGHAMAEILGGLTHLQHGKTVAVFLPAVLKLLEDDYQLELSCLKKDLGDINIPAYKQISDIWQKTGLPLTMSDMRIQEKYRSMVRRDTLSNAIWAMDANPIHITDKDIDKILTNLWIEKTD